MNKHYKVSLITIAYDNVADIESTLLSVASQDYPNIEYIVVDGASTDGTHDVIRKHEAAIDRFISEPDDGMYDAINKGIRLASGDIVGLIHAGDRLYSHDVISQIVNAFQDQDLEATYGHSVLVDANDRPVRVNRSKAFSRARIRRGWMPSHQSIYLRRELFERNGLYRTDLGGSGDYEFFIRYFYKHQVKARLIDMSIVRFSLGGQSTSNYLRLMERQAIHRNCWNLNQLQPPIMLIPFKLARKVPQFFQGLWLRMFPGMVAK
jgi:glycosyltransferase involved in cell wall biosynthesis